MFINLSRQSCLLILSVGFLGTVLVNAQPLGLPQEGISSSDEEAAYNAALSQNSYDLAMQTRTAYAKNLYEMALEIISPLSPLREGFNGELWNEPMYRLSKWLTRPSIGEWARVELELGGGLAIKTVIMLMRFDEQNRLLDARFESAQEPGDFSWNRGASLPWSASLL